MRSVMGLNAKANHAVSLGRLPAADNDYVGACEDYWTRHPEPSDEDILAVCRAWVSYQREEAARGDVVRGARAITDRAVSGEPGRVLALARLVVLDNACYVN